jgi:hypothetical protein
MLVLRGTGGMKAAKMVRNFAINISVAYQQFATEGQSTSVLSHHGFTRHVVIARGMPQV